MNSLSNMARSEGGRFVDKMVKKKKLAEGCLRVTRCRSEEGARSIGKRGTVRN